MTLFGLCLAGAQLYISYVYLARGINVPDMTAEMTLERERISLKSSFLGLSILLISFAFFVIYALFVYRLEVVDMGSGQNDQPAQVQAPAATIQSVSIPIGTAADQERLQAMLKARQ